MKLDLTLLGVVCLLNLCLGGLVLLRNRRALFSRYFFIISLFITAWAITNYLTNVHLSYTLSTVTNRAAYITSIIATLAALLFTYEFPLKHRISKKEKVLVAVAFVIPTLLSFTSLVSGNVVYSENARPTFTTGSLVIVYGIGFFVMVMLMVRNLMRGVRSDNVAVQRQSSFILFGFCVTAIVGFVLNMMIPIVVQDWQTTRFGPVLSLTLVGSVSYAIIRHGLFDIRAVVARSLGYVSALVVLSTLYGFLVFWIAQQLFDLTLPAESQVFFAAATAAVGLAFQPLRRIFDRATTHIFYQDSYDPQELFDQLNKLLVSSLDIDHLMRHSANIIAEHVRPDYCLIGLRDGARGQRWFGKSKVPFSHEDIRRIRALTPVIHRNVIVADYIEAEHHELKEVMGRNNIAVLVRLTRNVRSNDEGLGYMVLGLKKSGNTYNAQDMQTLESIANELVIAIQNALHYEEIQKFNLALQAKIDAATAKLRRTNEKLKELDEAKDDFVSMASHQLRTPLTSIKGYTSMVLEGDAGKINATQRKLLEQTFASSQRMVYLIADLLNVSRLKTGKFMIETGPVNMADIVQQEIGQLTETAAGRQLTLTYKQPESFPTLMLDETKTRQVIMNFVDNAIYYTPAGGHIEVQLIETPASVEFRVKDDGIGVPKSEQPHLFTKFYRAGNARTARPDGTGLGLFMAKKVVMAEGGAILFETEEGKGSTFGFVFSKSKLAPDTPVKAS